MNYQLFNVQNDELIFDEMFNGSNDEMEELFEKKYGNMWLYGMDDEMVVILNDKEEGFVFCKDDSKFEDINVVYEKMNEIIRDIKNN